MEQPDLFLKLRMLEYWLEKSGSFMNCSERERKNTHIIVYFQFNHWRKEQVIVVCIHEECFFIIDMVFSDVIVLVINWRFRSFFSLLNNQHYTFYIFLCFLVELEIYFNAKQGFKHTSTHKNTLILFWGSYIHKHLHIFR